MKKYNIGIEFGSTRIKAILINDKFEVLALGTYDWENKLKNKIWTYSQEDILLGLKTCFLNLKKDFESKGIGSLKDVTGLGISAMMHGYIALDKNNNFLVPFATWRNTNTKEAARKLSHLFRFNVPMRWSISHLYQAILNNEKHVKNIAYITTLAGYIHYLLTGKKVLGIGDASGMFPIDMKTHDYDQLMVEKFNKILKSKKLPFGIKDILPKVLLAGEDAGTLNKKGLTYLDDSLPIDIKLCPPEGDAETGMVATNSIKPLTGNVSAGTSVFSMVVLKKKLKKAYPEIDIVSTPHGYDVAMVHCNNFTSDINAWVNLFKSLFTSFNYSVNTNELYSLLFSSALLGDKDSGNIINFNYFSGEPITKCDLGKPLLVRNSDSSFTLANFMKSQIFSSLASLALGMNILSKEGIKIEKMCGHGGFFKSKQVAGRYMSAALKAPISILETASEGGAYGIALLSSFMSYPKKDLEDFLNKVFSKSKTTDVIATKDDIISFEDYIKKYLKMLKVERLASKEKI